MRPLRTSGEVINATLLEVFLTLAFLTLGLAAFEKVEADDAKSRARRFQGHAAAQATNAGRVLGIVLTALDSAKIATHLQPECEPEIRGDLVVVTLLADPGLAVTFKRNGFGFRDGQQLQVAEADFPRVFAAVDSISKEHGCRYWARIIDTPARSKDGFKRGGRVVASIFRVNGFLR